jgi:hypothetical protein
MLCFARDKCVPNVSGTVVRILDEQFIEHLAGQALIAQCLESVTLIGKAAEERADIIDDISQSFKLLGCKGRGGIDGKKWRKPGFHHLTHIFENLFAAQWFHFLLLTGWDSAAHKKREWRKAPCQKSKRRAGKVLVPPDYALSI